MKRLINRQQQIPNGFRFSLPEIKYNAPPFASFDTIVNSVARLTSANPDLSTKYGWPMDRRGVEDWVESFQVQLCEMNGWTNYITGGDNSAPPPKFKALSPMAPKQVSAVADKVKKVWQGVKSLNDWIDSGEPAVPQTLAQARADICVTCPQNGKGGLEEWFTKPASESIKRQFEKLSSRQLSTTKDTQLNVCTACLCPIRLLVHTPLKYKLAHMGEETRKALDTRCWILSEESSM